MKKKICIILIVVQFITFSSRACIDTTFNILVDTTSNFFRVIRNENGIFFSINYDSLSVIEIDMKHPKSPFSFLMSPLLSEKNVQVQKNINEIKFLDRISLAKLFFNQTKNLRYITTYLKTKEGWITEKRFIYYVGPRDCYND